MFCSVVALDLRYSMNDGYRMVRCINLMYYSLYTSFKNVNKFVHIFFHTGLIGGSTGDVLFAQFWLLISDLQLWQ